MAEQTIEELIERSSLGTPEAKAIRESVDPERARHVVEASRLLGRHGIWEEVAQERARAHIKHGDTSMESLAIDDLTRLTVLVEEVGEVARAFNEARHRPPLDMAGLREDLIQVAAMAGAWAEALTGLDFVDATDGEQEP